MYIYKFIRGSSFYEIVNMTMNLLSIISIILKYIYDYLITHEIQQLNAGS